MPRPRLDLQQDLSVHVGAGRNVGTWLADYGAYHWRVRAAAGYSAMKKDKQKVIDEVWDDARVRGFLDKNVPRQAKASFPGDPDFYVLRHAYQSMRAEDFGRFLDFYTADGRDVRARDNKGRTLAEIIAGTR